MNHIRLGFRCSAASAHAALSLGLALVAWMPRATSAQAPAPAPASTNKPPEGMVLHFGFDEAPANFAIPDLSGRGNHGRIAGASWTASGRVGGGVAFSSTDHFIVVPDAPSLNAKHVTFMAWVKAADGITGRTILDRHAGEGYALGIAGEDRGASKGRAIATVAGQTCIGDAVIADNFWHHLAASYDGETLKLYVDGAAQKQATPWKGQLGTAGRELTIGLNRSNPTPEEKGLSYQGILDDVRIFDRALDGPEITALFSASKPRFTKFEVARRIAELKDLKARGLLLDDFFERKMKECEQ